MQTIQTMHTNRHRKLVAARSIVWLLLACSHLSAEDKTDDGPWRLQQAFELPAWLDISGTHRTRFENLDGQFRTGRPGGDQILALRTTLQMKATVENMSFVGEWLDARQELADSGSPLDTTIVNASELLQAYASLRLDGLLDEDAGGELRLGRQTMDIGSRRLVARNSFRNTINAFNGLHVEWQHPNGPSMRMFYVLPITRLPSDASSLLDNDVEFDEENFNTQFWGIHAQWPKLVWDSTAEAYLFGLHESDSPGMPTRNRQLYTPGLRLARKPAAENWDFDVESVAQLGTMRGSTAAADTRDLDHLAFFVHGEVGYTFATAWSPRLAALYDYASGDDSPTDGKSNRFDTLYGARRFEHGPTGIYGAFARANIQSPGLRLTARPCKPLELMAAYRAYWLASDTDAWTSSGVRDASGNSGSFIGHALEAGARWDALPGNMRVEAGCAFLFSGDFVENAPNATYRGDSVYGYVSVEFTF